MQARAIKISRDRIQIVMTSYIIVARNGAQQKQTSDALLEKLQIALLDRTYASVLKESSKDKKKALTKTKTIGINDVKDMQKTLYLKPLKSTQKALIIEEAEFLSQEAQNALLKVLEEPPEHTIIILSTTTIEALLPTIRSRCYIIQNDSNKIISEEERSDATSLLLKLENLTVGEALNLSELHAKTKEVLLSWLEITILVINEKILSEDTEKDLLKQYAHIIRKMQQLHTLISSTNANARHATEVFFLEFIKN